MAPNQKAAPQQNVVTQLEDKKHLEQEDSEWTTVRRTPQTRKKRYNHKETPQEYKKRHERMEAEHNAYLARKAKREEKTKAKAEDEANPALKAKREKEHQAYLARQAKREAEEQKAQAVRDFMAKNKDRLPVLFEKTKASIA